MKYAMPDVLTPKEVGAVLSLSRNSVYELFHAQGFPAFKVGNQFRVRREKLVEWMDKIAATKNSLNYD